MNMETPCFLYLYYFHTIYEIHFIVFQVFLELIICFLTVQFCVNYIYKVFRFKLKLFFSCVMFKLNCLLICILCWRVYIPLLMIVFVNRAYLQEVARAHVSLCFSLPDMVHTFAVGRSSYVCSTFDPYVSNICTYLMQEVFL